MTEIEKVATPYGDPKLYMMLVIEGFLIFMKYIAGVDLNGLNISIESEVRIINY